MSKYDSVDPSIQIHCAKLAYEEKSGKTFSKLMVAIDARKYSRKAVAVVQTYQVNLVSQKDLDELLKKNNVSRKQIQRRLFAAKIFDTWTSEPSPQSFFQNMATRLTLFLKRDQNYFVFAALSEKSDWCDCKTKQRSRHDIIYWSR